MKLSSTLKSVTTAAEARLEPTPAPPRIRDIFSKIEREAEARRLSLWSWLVVLTATTITMNSPESMTALFQHSSASKPLTEGVAIAEFMREVGLRCMGINGIPRTINMLSAFRASLPLCIASSLDAKPSRCLHVSNIESVNARGRALWKQIHRPLDTKLEHKLAQAHPDLPVFIVHNVYGGLFADPERVTGAMLGRIATSLCAIACLRAQQGVGPQLLGHVCGLKKAWEDGSWKSDPHAGEEHAVRWLVSDEGCIWVLQKIDELVEALSEGQGSTFAPTRPKL